MNLLHLCHSFLLTTTHPRKLDTVAKTSTLSAHHAIPVLQSHRSGGHTPLLHDVGSYSKQLF